MEGPLTTKNRAYTKSQALWSITFHALLCGLSAVPGIGFLLDGRTAYGLAVLSHCAVQLLMISIPWKAITRGETLD